MICRFIIYIKSFQKAPCVFSHYLNPPPEGIFLGNLQTQLTNIP